MQFRFEVFLIQMEEKMPCRARVRHAGIPQHVIQRGNNRAACFFADEDYLSYLDSLLEGATRYIL